MADKETPAATAKDIVVEPKTKTVTIKSGENASDIIRKGQEILNGGLAIIAGSIQRQLKGLLDECNNLTELGFPIKWEDAAYTEYLSNLKLQPISTETASIKKGGKKKSKKDWSESEGKRILEKYSKGDEFSIAECAKKLDLSENTLRMYLGKGTKSGYLESLGDGKYKVLKK